MKNVSYRTYRLSLVMRNDKRVQKLATTRRNYDNLKMQLHGMAFDGKHPTGITSFRGRGRADRTGEL